MATACSATGRVRRFLPPGRGSKTYILQVTVISRRRTSASSAPTSAATERRTNGVTAANERALRIGRQEFGGSPTPALAAGALAPGSCDAGGYPYGSSFNEPSMTIARQCVAALPGSNLQDHPVGCRLVLRSVGRRYTHVHRVAAHVIWVGRPTKTKGDFPPQRGNCRRAPI